jgi:heterodisulfide reductase subunit A
MMSTTGTTGTEMTGRVGVFLCECGEDVAPVVDLRKLAERLKGAEPPVSVYTTRLWCSPAGRRLLADTIANDGLDAAVVAGCSERMLGPLMRRTAAAAGVNPNRVALVNLREHCASVHRGKRAAATAKAARLVRAGIERVRRAAKLEPIVSEVERSAAVIGGGISGLTVAHSLSARGIPVTLIEQDAELGGRLRDINKLFPSYRDAAEYAAEVVSGVADDPNIDVLTRSAVTGVTGHAGNYSLTLVSEGDARELRVGSVVLATGADVLLPDGLFGYGTSRSVVTQLEFESMLRKGLGDKRRIVMIQCAGSRNEERPYCSRVCCTATVKNTITVLDQMPDAEITVLTRGFAQYVGDLDRARSAGVSFLRYDPERPPEVGDGSVGVFDVISAEEVSIPCDLVVLATPLVAYEETGVLADMLGVPADRHGFVAEPHTKLRPGRFAPGGVFVVGSAHWPATVTECQSQAYSAAARVAELLEADVIEREPIVAAVDELTCRGCGDCVDACAHDAMTLADGDDGIRTATVDTVKCVGCGVCTQVCPSSAATLRHLTPRQLLAMVGAATGK